jgi:hypothetical protein
MNIDSDYSEKVKIKKDPQELSKSFYQKEEFKTSKKKPRDSLISDISET